QTDSLLIAARLPIGGGLPPENVGAVPKETRRQTSRRGTLLPSWARMVRIEESVRGGEAGMLNRNVRLLTVALGLWAVLSSLLLGRRDTALAVNSLVTGIIIIISALLAMRRPQLGFVSAAGGIWLIASLFAWPNYSSPTVWNNAIVGAG